MVSFYSYPLPCWHEDYSMKRQEANAQTRRLNLENFGDS